MPRNTHLCGNSAIRSPLWPCEVSVTSVALLNQIRAVDRMRLIKRLGVVNAETMEQVDEAIKISLGLIRL